MLSVLAPVPLRKTHASGPSLRDTTWTNSTHTRTWYAPFKTNTSNALTRAHPRVHILILTPTHSRPDTCPRTRPHLEDAREAAALVGSRRAQVNGARDVGGAAVVLTTRVEQQQRVFIHHGCSCRLGPDDSTQLQVGPS